MLTLKINGEDRQCPEVLTVAGLIEALGYTGKRIAVEKNGEIVPKSQHASTALSDGDQAITPTPCIWQAGTSSFSTRRRRRSCART